MDVSLADQYWAYYFASRLCLSVSLWVYTARDLFWFYCSFQVCDNDETNKKKKRQQQKKSSDSAIFLIRNNETKMNYDIRKSTQMLWKRIEI